MTKSYPAVDAAIMVNPKRMRWPHRLAVDFLCRRFNLYHLTQMDQMGCGPTCLRMISASFGRPISARAASRVIPTSRIGVSIADMVEGGQRLGIVVKPQWVQANALDCLNFPVILLWRQSHYIVLWGKRGKRFLVSDPASSGKIRISRKDIDDYWTIPEKGCGIVLACFPSEDTLDTSLPGTTEKKPRAFISYLAGHRRTIALLGLAYAIIVTATVSIPLILMLILRSVTTDSGDMTPAGLLALIVLLAGTRFIFEQFRSYWLLKISAASSQEMLNEFFKCIFAFSYLRYAQRKYGDYLMKLNAYEYIRTQMKSSSFYVIFDIMTLLAVAALLTSIDVRIALTYMLALAAIVVASLIGLPRARLLRFQGYNVQSVTRTMEADILRGMQDIKVSGKEGAFHQKWIAQIRDAHAIDERMISLREIQRNFATLTLGICSAASIVVMLGEVRIGAAQYSDMLFVVILLGLVSVPSQQFAEFVRSIDDLLFYIRQMQDIHDTIDVDTTDSVQHEAAQRSVAGWSGQPLEPGLHLRGLSFSHPVNRRFQVIDGLDLSIPVGGTVALFGASGSGKSTVAKIAAGLYPPTGGDVIWAATEHGHLTPRIAAVMQDSMLFTLTARENIAFGVPETDIDMERLGRVISLACLEQVIARLPMNAGTLLGPSGHQVSGGEKQRLLIARALYEEPDLLVLDEATSGLDKDTEAQVLTGIRQAFPHLAILLVSHSAAVTQLADRVAVISGGRIVACAAHTNLQQNCQVYRNLLRTNGLLQHENAS
ncbi:ATP-binding cassette domain-containing protein [Rhizobium sp. FKY42]|uniref:peptidase domain-containing ABC transporter n=1 Tax=Rhizobium sp. FKY42 TaxID=2562310 RepID=UPI0010C14A08|nr:ATP-binding cassette domain-containing protein [Rhizobium sp. FKY42]